MADRITNDEIDTRLRAADPLRTWLPPSQDETEATLQALLIRGPGSPGARRPAIPRLRLAAGAAAALGAAAATIALILGTSSPAFAVTRNRDGTITVRIITLSGIAGANHKLAQLGVRATIVTAAQMARLMAVTHPCRGQRPGAVRTVTFTPSMIPRRQVLVLSVDRTGSFALAARALEQARHLIHSTPQTIKLIHRARVIAFSVAPRIEIGKRGADNTTIHCGQSFALRVSRADAR